MSPTSRKLYPFGNTLLVPLAVGLQLPIRHDRYVPTAIKKLHHLPTFTRHRCPFRFSVGVLFESAKFVIFEPEVNLFEPPTRSLPDRIFFVSDLDVGCAVNKGLTPYRNENMFGHQKIEGCHRKGKRHGIEHERTNSQFLGCRVKIRPSRS
jgi:hypothetical protein